MTSPEASQLVDGIRGKIAPVSTPMTYRVAMLVAAIVMILLPLIYITLVLSILYGVYVYATNATSLFNGVRGRGVVAAGIAYLGPIVAGVIAVVFMFKPLFSRPARQADGTTLKREDQPLLFDFVDRLCRSVHAPAPSQINVDCEVNASASFRNGILGLLTNRLVLTIGLPLVQGMTLRQFSGILAHEFGHFAQGGGMRLTYIIRSVSHWFTRVVYERDEWDVTLENWSQGVDIRIGIIFYVARFFVWLTRKVLWCLMIVGHGVAGFLLRQMEFDADRHEVRFSGSDQIERTTRRLQELGVAHQMAFSDLGLAFEEGRLADNLTELIDVNAEDLPEDVQEKITAHIDEGRTGWLDTHPCDRERIASGEAENAPGIFTIEGPSTQLFHDFENVCRQATSDTYRDMIGDEFRPSHLHSTKALVEARRARQAAAKALESFSQDQWTPLCRIDVPETVDTCELTSSPADALTDARNAMLEKASEQKMTLEKLDLANDEFSDGLRAEVCHDSNCRVRKETFRVDLSDRQKTEAYVRDVVPRMADIRDAYACNLKPFEERLWLALSMVGLPTVQADVANAEHWQTEISQRLLPALKCISRNHRAVLELGDNLNRFGHCFQLLENGLDNDEVRATARKWMGRLAADCRKVSALFDVAYPFEHSENDMTIQKFYVSQLPGKDDPSEVFSAAEGIMQSHFSLYHRVMSRLCDIAVQVESHFGLETLPIIEKPDEPDEDTHE